MKKFLIAISAACTLSTFTARAQTEDSGVPLVDAANRFLASLSVEQRQKVVFDFDDDQQRARWSNFPTGVVPRGGISFRQMNDAQREAAMKLLATVLSPAGLVKVNLIRQADDDFKANGSRRGPPGGGGARAERGGPPPGGPTQRPEDGRPPLSGNDLFGSDLYYFSFVGSPSRTKPWMLQFGGHHLALNVTVVGGKRVLTPTLTGAQPAMFQANGATIRPLGHESDKALSLLKSLDESQRRQAVLGYAVADLVLGPGQDGRTIVSEGLKASAMSGAQREMLIDLLSEWAGIATEPAAAERMRQLRDELDQTWFAWSGPTTAKAGGNITAYYRIQGPHLVVEYAPQNDEPDNHVHTIYRDPTDDYGRSTAPR